MQKIGEFGIGSAVEWRDAHRFQRHAADRTGARPLLYDFGVHRAGEHRAFRRRRRVVFRFRIEISRRVGGELRLTALAAKMIGRAVVLVRGLADGRVDSHAAHRVDGSCSRRRRRARCRHCRFRNRLFEQFRHGTATFQEWRPVRPPVIPHAMQHLVVHRRCGILAAAL